MMFKSFGAVALAVLAVSSMGISAQEQELAPINKDVQELYYALLTSSDGEDRVQAAEEIHLYGGFSDEKLFSLLEERLLYNYKTENIKSISYSDELSWVAKALASSGDEKYLELLTSVAQSSNSRKLRRHAESVVESFPLYKIWNEAFRTVPFRSTSYDPRRIAAYKRIFQSKNEELIVRAAQLMYQYSAIEDESLYEVIKQVIQGYLQRSDLNDEQAESLGWLLAALSVRGLHVYDDFIKEAALVNVSDDPVVIAKVRRAANKSLNRVERFAEWNAVILGEENEISGRAPLAADILDLWRSGNIDMQIYAIRIAYAARLNDPEFESLLREYMLKNLGHRSHTSDTTDLLGWTCRYFARFRNEANYHALSQFYESTKLYNRKFQRLSSDALKNYR